MPESPITSLRRPGVKPIPYVVVKLPNGKLVLRHPDELEAVPGQWEPPAPPK